MPAPPPPLDLDSLCAAVAAGAAPLYRCFWGHKPRKDGQLSESCLSQWWPCRFEVAGQTYSSAEQFMMAGKARLFEDDATLEHILTEHDPGRVKALGRRVQGYDDERWDAVRFDLVTAGSLAKFGEDGKLRAFLLGTGDAVLVEASPTDSIWGIGLSSSDLRARDPLAWQGLNLLGFALMRARAVLRGELSAPALPPCAG